MFLPKQHKISLSDNTHNCFVKRFIQTMSFPCPTVKSLNFPSLWSVRLKPTNETESKDTAENLKTHRKRQENKEAKYGKKEKK